MLPAGAIKGETLAAQVRAALEEYFGCLNGEQPIRLYDLVLAEVERPLLEVVMQRVQGNKAKAAALLGIHPATLRKRLVRHGLLAAPPKREQQEQRKKGARARRRGK